MRIEVGRVSKEAAQEKAARKQNVYDIHIKREKTSKDGGEEEIVMQQRKIFESTEGHYKEETAPSQETEMKAIHMQPAIEDSSLNEEDCTEEQDVLETFRGRSEGKDFNTRNFQEPDSRRKNNDVKLWAHQESNKNKQLPKRITLQIGSLSGGNTMRFVEAEKARVIRQITEEHDNRLGRAKDTRQLGVTRDQTCKDLEPTNELAWYGVHEDKEGKALRFDKDRSAEPMDPEQGDREPMVKEQGRAKDWTAEVMVKRRTGFAAFSQELTPVAMSGGKTKLKGEKDQRPLDDNRAQPEAKATLGAEQLIFPVVSSGQVPGTKEQTDATGKKPTSIRPKFETVKKNDRRATGHSKEKQGGTTTLTSHPVSSRGSKNYTSCQGDKWAGKYEKHAAQQGEGQDEIKELQKRAIFHLEALRRIEETYKSKMNGERNSNLWTKSTNKMPLHHPEYRDNSSYRGVHEAQKNKVRKWQKKGQGGLNALLAPAFEEEMQRQWQISDENSPTNSFTEKQVLKFQRMKKARLKAAEDQISAIKASVQQRRAQLKATVDPVAKGRAVETVKRKEKGISGECLAHKDNFTTKLPQERLFTNTASNSLKTTEQPIKRINGVIEKARAEEQMQAERRRRTKLQEKTSPRVNKAGPGHAAIQLYGRLNRNQRKEKLGQLSKVSGRFKSPSHEYQTFNDSNRLKHPQFSPHTANGRFKSPFDSSQKLNCSNRSKHPQLRANAVNSRFKSPPTSPRKGIKTNALEHFANWEKELRTAQRSRSLSKERSTERRLAIQESPLQNDGEREKSELRKRGGATGRLFAEGHSKSPKRNYSSGTMPSNEAIPDHYNSVDQDCTCELQHQKEKRAKTRLKAFEEETPETAKGAYKKENRQPLSWLGRLYNTITSLS